MDVPVKHFPPLVRKSAVQDFLVKFITTNSIEQESLSIEGTPYAQHTDHENSYNLRKKIYF